MQHSDFDVFCNAILLRGGEFVHHDFTRDFKLPCSTCGVVEIPQAEVYESVEVHFESKPSKALLKFLRFPS